MKKLPALLLIFALLCACAPAGGETSAPSPAQTAPEPEHAALYRQLALYIRQGLVDYQLPGKYTLSFGPLEEERDYIRPLEGARLCTVTVAGGEDLVTDHNNFGGGDSPFHRETYHYVDQRRNLDLMADYPQIGWDTEGVEQTVDELLRQVAVEETFGFYDNRQGENGYLDGFYLTEDKLGLIVSFSRYYTCIETDLDDLPLKLELDH